MNPTQSEPPVAFTPTDTPARKFHWPVFLVALLLPPILTLATAQAGWKDFPVACALFGSGLGGIICGVLLGLRIGKTTTAIVLFSLLFTTVFICVCFALCFGGCLLGNYQLNLH
jgi:hypothetical protein